MVLQDQVDMLKCIAGREGSWVMHVDATGSVIKSDSQSCVYLYSVVTPCPQPREPCLPLFEFITDNHSVPNLTTALTSWYVHILDRVQPPEVIVIDFSWALLHSLCRSICMEKITSHIERLWNKMLRKGDNEGPIIRLCLAHFIKAAQRRLSKTNASKEVGLSEFHDNYCVV
jgi:hypothetical protein